jgi:ubiquinone/menaquinone biosynthesis C-methylase UbiE
MSKPASKERPQSKVEVTGFEARHYDMLMNVVTGGTYPFFIRSVVLDMGIKADDSILILGSGTGRNACLMGKYLGDEGRITGLDIGEEMLEQANRRCRSKPGFSFEKRRIEQPLPWTEQFDRVFIAFVLHGFIQEERLAIIQNAQKALKPGGSFHILDYQEMEPDRASWPVRQLFRVECPLATDFVRRDWREILATEGFSTFASTSYYFDVIRQITATRD